MTREKAIEILIAVAVCDRPILSCDFCARYVGMGTDCTYPSDKEIEESVLLLKGASNDAAISALRQQETVANRNEPLTLDELRKMDGEPVWVQSPGAPEYGRWAIAEGVGENCLFLHDDFTCHDYGKTWLAYRRAGEEDKHEPN